ncbi:MAG TPA: signal peptidase I [Opitutaceae bacterium]|nr:signal peptidase I [Opitutaceae bacterium]
MRISPVVPEVSLITRATKALLGLVGIRDSEQKMREHAANWLELADKVWHYRRDRLSAADAGALNARTDELRQRLKERADAAKLKLSMESLEAVLQRTGGAVYPKTALVENVEFFLVAAIVILGIRTYFVQPFKIPTNSMWPSYYGMTAENLPPGTEAPGLAARAFRLAAFGAVRKEAIAPQSGEVSVLLTDYGTLAATPRSARKWLVIPTTVNEYTFYVGDSPTTVRVPVDFSGLEKIVAETYFGSQEAFIAERARLARAGRLSREPTGRLDRVVRMPLGKTAKAGEPVVRFDLLTGDQLFVDRMSYHFVRPKVGQGFVFRTGNIPGIADVYGDQYYIKRLVGTPGDTLEINEPVLLRNGRPIEGADAFAKNAGREGKYRGYFNGSAGNGARYLLDRSQKLTVPANSFFALGDNSGQSSDGRYWGFVPAKDVAGRPLFIYYPFTSRWGPAR